MDKHQNLRKLPEDFQAGAMLLIDKPYDWTSFDVVNKLRYILSRRLGVKRLKVGHAGTLDPMATGLLIVCTGKWTKRINEFQGLSKLYTGTFKLGATTPSYDAETEINNTFPTDHITDELIEAARLKFIGTIDQLPPIYSAIKVDGQPLYKKARKGIEVKVQPRQVTFHDFIIKENRLPEIDFEAHCSKGTYIRSLAYDFGKEVNSGAYLNKLVRTKIGEYKLEDAWNLEEIIELLST